MTHEQKRREERARERRIINTYAPLEALEKIAHDHVPALIGRQNGLDTMDSDDLDFFEVSVWGLKEALIEAYRLGQKDGYREAVRCKKCKNREIDAFGRTVCVRAGQMFEVQDCDFCSYGERREEDNT
jgi:hypothetical protein